MKPAPPVIKTISGKILPPAGPRTAAQRCLQWIYVFRCRGGLNNARDYSVAGAFGVDDNPVANREGAVSARLPERCFGTRRAGPNRRRLRYPEAAPELPRQGEEPSSFRTPTSRRCQV